jgi:dTDP-4-amino-4,6-dideoxygalactose transaminase
MNSKFSPWPSFTQEEIDTVRDVLSSNNVNYWTGNECRAFEKEFAFWADSKHAVALANGTLALDVAFKALSIGVGDEVIVTSRTFIASISSIINSGATPVFVDIDSESQNITPLNINSAITTKTKAIVCVHLAGWPCDMDEIMTIASNHNLYVVEDCAQAHGAVYKGQSVGSIGHIGCWSFCQDKIMTTGGEGGMVTTNNDLLWRKMWAYKDHGKSYEAVYEREHPEGFRWLHESFGTNWRMLEMQAAIGRIQLKRMPEWTRARNRNATILTKAFSRFAGKNGVLRIPKFKCCSCPSVKGNCDKKCVHAFYKYYIFINTNTLKNGWNRDRIIAEINAQGVPCFQGSCSEVYLEKAFDNKDYRPKDRLPVAKKLGETSLMFLVHPTLGEEEMNSIAKITTSIFTKAAS